MELPAGQKDFDTVPSNGKLIFGGYNEDGTKNPAFFTSVHLGGDEQAALEKELIRKAKEEWESKVIVDRVDFVAHQTTRVSSSVLDKKKDILDGKPKKRGLRIVRNATLPSGKRVPLRPAPAATIFMEDEYEDPVDFTTTLKPNDATTFLGTDKAGKPVGFNTAISNQMGKPKSQTMRYVRKVDALTAKEKTGPRWDFSTPQPTRVSRKKK